MKTAFPTLIITDASVTVHTGKIVWETPWDEADQIVADPKGILIKRRDGTAGRFKASNKTIVSILRCLDAREVPYTRSTTSTLWMVSAEAKTS